MGLRLYTTPVDGPAEAVKLAEKTSAHARSTIRRQPTIRRGSNFVLAPDQRTSEAEEVEIAAARARLARRTSRRSRSYGAQGSGGEIRGTRPDLPHTVPISFNPVAPLNAPHISGASVMPPVPETEDFSARRRHRVTSPDLLAENRQERSVNAMLLQRPLMRRIGRRDGSLSHLTNRDSSNFEIRHGTMPRLTDPRRAISRPPVTSLRDIENHRAPLATRQTQTTVTRVDATNEERNQPRRPFSPVVNPHLYLPEFPSDQRLNSISLRPTRRFPRLGGLGDRDRSLSPEAEDPAAWDTILTTITPDPQPPSAGSSFASASAQTASRGSGDTVTTWSSIDDASLEPVCDIIDGDSDVSVTDIEEEFDFYSPNDNAHEGERRFWQTYADAVTSREDRTVAEEPDDLIGMRTIVGRLARRGDIPPSWWNSVGLSRNFPHEGRDWADHLESDL